MKNLMRNLPTKQRVLIAILSITILTLSVMIESKNHNVESEDKTAFGFLIEVDKPVKYKYTSLNKNNSDYEIAIIYAQHNISQNQEPSIVLTEQELELLYAITWAEAGNEPFEGQVAVAEVIINRVNSDIYPDTLREVVYQGGGSQFNGVRRDVFGYYDEQITVEAVNIAIQNPSFDPSVVYFANPAQSTNRGFINRVIVPNNVSEIGKHVFAYEPKIKLKEGED